MLFHKTYDLNDLINIVQKIIFSDLHVKNVQVDDQFDKDLNMNKVTKEKIVLATEHVLNYEITLEDRKKINSIHDILVIYKNSLNLLKRKLFQDFSLKDNG